MTLPPGLAQKTRMLRKLCTKKIHLSARPHLDPSLARYSTIGQGRSPRRILTVYGIYSEGWAPSITKVGATMRLVAYLQRVRILSSSLYLVSSKSMTVTGMVYPVFGIVFGSYQASCFSSPSVNLRH